MVNENIKLVRKTLRYKQKDVAKELGLSQHHLSDIERGLKKPSTILIKSYCCHYGVNEELLLTGQGKMFDSDKKAGVYIVGKIESLYALKNNGAITEEDFNLLKNKLLSPLKGKGTDA